MTVVSSATRQVVLERDAFACVSCGHGIRGPLGYSLQHRTPRGMGGDKRPESNSPANLITLCGSATTGCHGWAEGNVQWSDRQQVLTWGYVVPRYLNPADIHVLTAAGWVRYDDDGCIRYIDAPDGTAPTSAFLREAIRTRTGA